MRAIIADTESTGFADDSEIIEAAWIDVPSTIKEFMSLKRYSGLSYYHQRFKPTSQMQFGAMATHNIIPDDLEDMARSELFEYPDDVHYLIGHNIDYDWRMFGEPTGFRICTLALSRWLFPELDSHKQTAMIYFMGWQIGDLEWARNLVKESHNALIDVNVCAILLRFLILEIQKRGMMCDTWHDLHALSETARIPTVMNFGKHKGELVKDVPSSYVQWYRRQDETDPYYIEAFKRAGK